MYLKTGPMAPRFLRSSRADLDKFPTMKVECSFRKEVKVRKNAKTSTEGAGKRKKVAAGQEKPPKRRKTTSNPREEEEDLETDGIEILTEEDDEDDTPSGSGRTRQTHDPGTNDGAEDWEGDADEEEGGDWSYGLRSQKTKPHTAQGRRSNPARSKVGSNAFIDNEIMELSSD